MAAQRAPYCSDRRLQPDHPSDELAPQFEFMAVVAATPGEGLIFPTGTVRNGHGSGERNHLDAGTEAATALSL
jgi:hypothetical protein